jgi:hypothetical protein
MTTVATNTTVACSPCAGAWTFGGGTWSISGNTAPTSGTYYVEGNIKITGNPASAKAPAVLTLIAEGSIEISGKPYIQPHTTGLLLVTDSDLKISGNPGLNYAEAQILVHEQMQISGNPDITGQILVENGPNLSTLVDENKISGNPNIIYNGTVGSSAFQVSSWRWIQ